VTGDAYMAAMRLLVILGLILASLVMVRPAAAATGEMTADCHAMAADHAADRGAGDKQHEPEDRPAALHSCPGCASLGAVHSVTIRTVRIVVPHLLHASIAGPSLATSPIPPPPRAA